METSPVMEPLSSPSFFPTSRELSIGFQWLRAHPVIATASAAAETAVSVLTLLTPTTKMTRIVSWEDEERGIVRKNKTVTDFNHLQKQSIVEKVKVEKEYATESPQWGWYVAITPPTDFVNKRETREE